MRDVLAALLVLIPAGEPVARMPAAIHWQTPLEAAMVAHVRRRNPSAPAEDVVAAAQEAGRRYGLDPVLLLAIADVESRYDPCARGALGEGGLMQIRHGTARSLGLNWRRVHDVRANLDAGARYLASHIQRYGDLRRAVSRYNGGSRRYANLVLGRYYQLSVSLSGTRL